jgi:NADPH-dependent 7-cyano-7-deazaguanine reductase QueF-like protein
VEAKIIRRFLPDLVTAISDSILPVSSACFAKGIVSETTYSSVLQSGGTNEVKTNNLLLAVIKSTETDSRCFGIFLNVLNEVLPFAVKDAVLSAMRKELSDQAAQCMSTSVVSWGRNSQMATGRTPLVLTSGEVVKQQTSLIGKLEDAIRQHERACVEKRVLKGNVKTKEEENKRLKNELDSLKQNKTTDTAVNESLLVSTKSRISACENEMTDL